MATIDISKNSSTQDSLAVIEKIVFFKGGPGVLSHRVANHLSRPAFHDEMRRSKVVYINNRNSVNQGGTPPLVITNKDHAEKLMQALQNAIELGRFE